MDNCVVVGGPEVESVLGVSRYIIVNDGIITRSHESNAIIVLRHAVVGDNTSVGGAEKDAVPIAKGEVVCDGVVVRKP